jgi:Ca2+-binding RTX toxin-like protein
MADVFTGGDGDDTEIGSYDRMYGNGGDDILGSFKNVFVKIYGGDGEDQLTYFGPNMSRLKGDDGNDWLYGGAQYDWVIGGRGDDWLFGNLGNDWLVGNGGRNHFAFNTAPDSQDNKDEIDGFKPNKDFLHFNNDVYTAAGDEGKLPKDQFRLGAKAKDGNDIFGYNPKNGVVWYDLNANDPGGFTKVAVLDEGLLVTHINYRID